ncbi:SGNH/GDSL hydrolase family protein [Paracraurococcus lichenis]|uniref:SGNH/GDSL hydrolase family protein n=1 Tax=Paracraurococcus lichenis TaxID=3064888 RepID=A0ABT9DWS4_9PROT|nr:SGNH/GDSL hydrolase family protein [Paracraurococcus sp. LOR1-02]MDO9708342.1 SGNH/GDSL hydrolase family protein [Paracraurococcus sp. LOR1-02]
MIAAARLLGPLLLLGALVAPAAGSATPICQAPAELLEAGAPLPAMLHAVQAGALRVLVVGGASVLGPGTSGPAAAWPARLEALIAERRPGLRIEVVVRARRGISTAEAGALLAGEMARAPAQLVLWATGTESAVRGREVDEMVDALNEGLDALRAAGADAVLMDPQFSRFLRANANVEPYLDALRLVAAAHKVPLLRRWDLMRHWAETEQVDVERAPKPERVAATDRLNDCLAQAIAALLRDGAAEARATGR